MEKVGLKVEKVRLKGGQGKVRLKGGKCKSERLKRED